MHFGQDESKYPSDLGKPKVQAKACYAAHAAKNLVEAAVILFILPILDWQIFQQLAQIPVQEIGYF
jgi:hypothetical protein